MSRSRAKRLPRLWCALQGLLPLEACLAAQRGGTGVAGGESGSARTKFAVFRAGETAGGKIHRSASPTHVMSLPRMNIRPFDLGSLLRGDTEVIAGWINWLTARLVVRQVLVIVIGAGAFGAAMGSWRAPEQAVWSAIKLPWVLIATAVGNALLNGLLAPLLGLDLRLRESFAAILTSFTLAALILGAFSPLMMFLVWNLPPPQPGVPMAVAARSVMLLMLVGTIAFAGVTANLRLLYLLRHLGGSAAAARRLLFAWLAVNLLLGTQISWVARPFIGKADVAVTFFELHALEGSFFEELTHTVGELWLCFFP
jgi:hypothetical protein